MGTKKIEHLVNHIVLVLDGSGSMRGQPVEAVVDREIDNLKQRSVDLNQETRISIYLFNTKVENLVFDMDVMRFKTLRGLYDADGQTALIDATMKGLGDHQHIPELYDDHAFLAYVITDGQENASVHRSGELATMIENLPDNWTVACLVPDANGEYEAKKFGFPAGSIAKWDTHSAKGFEEVGKQFTTVTSNYMTMRASGVRSTKGLFTLDSKGLHKSDLKPIDFSYQIYNILHDGRIDEAVEDLTGRRYVPGSTFYQPMKAVKIQDYKEILVQNVKSGIVYSGENIRQLLGLPSQTVEVNPGQHKDWKIFVQSTSLNRKLFAGTQILVRMDY
jgi:hypothetical protein